MRNKNILKSIGFLTGLFIILIIISYLFIPTNSVDDGPYRKMGGILKEPKNTMDYLAIGDSECVAGITPMEIYKEYGYTGYNCGVPGQRLEDTYYMLKKMLQHQSPKVILLETNAFYRNYNHTEALQNHVQEATKKIFPIYKYHNNWRYFNIDMLKNIDPKPKSKGPNALKGFHYYATVKPYLDGPYIQKTNKVETIHKQPRFYLNKIINLCKEKDIQLIFYSVPSPLCWTYAKHNAAAAIADNNNIPFLDLNLNHEELGIDWLNDTRDEGNHVNFYGAKKVTSYIGSYLSKNSNLKDHRRDSRYKAWNKALNRYLKLTKQI